MRCVVKFTVAIIRNVCRVFLEVIPLEQRECWFLHSNNCIGYTLSYSSEMQMADVSVFVLISPTASNILIRKRCGCSGGVFRCPCPEDAKCLVKLSDFDSVKTFQRKEFPGWHQEWWPYVRMSPEECEQVMGTPGYRAPEVCRLFNLNQHTTQLGVHHSTCPSVCLSVNTFSPTTRNKGTLQVVHVCTCLYMQRREFHTLVPFMVHVYKNECNAIICRETAKATGACARGSHSEIHLHTCTVFRVT
jgi:serine/threonine protein kinase